MNPRPPRQQKCLVSFWFPFATKRGYQLQKRTHPPPSPARSAQSSPSRASGSAHPELDTGAWLSLALTGTREQMSGSSFCLRAPAFCALKGTQAENHNPFGEVPVKKKTRPNYVQLFARSTQGSPQCPTTHKKKRGVQRLPT